MFYAKSKKMKRLFVFIPAILLVLFLLNSFVLKEFKSGPANIVFKSTDGGQTWQDISKGLPENLRENGIRGDSIIANDKGLFLRVGNGFYHNAPNATAPFWTKEEHSSIASDNSGILAHNYWGVNVKKTNGTSVWSPILEIFNEPRIRSTFETADGAVFIGTAKGFFKTADNGKTWTLVHTGSLVGHLAESNGVLVAISTKKIIRSTDNGETWEPTISEDSVAWDVKQIKGGFAAMTSGSMFNTRRVSTSYDGGKTWQSGDGSLQDKAFVDSIRRTWDDRPVLQAFATSIIQVGENFFCTHAEGIFKSSDKGKTWKLLLPSIDGRKGFNLFVSGNVVYAIPSKGGC